MQILIAAVGVFILFSVAYSLPSYRITTVSAEYVHEGAVVLTRSGRMLGRGCVVSGTFLFHGRSQRPQTWLGLVDGSDVEWDISALVQIAKPHDFFRAIRSRPASGRQRPEQPSVEASEVLAATWNVRLRLNHEEVSLHELEEAHGHPVSDAVEELLRLHLVRRVRRLRGINLTITDTGCITLAAAMRAQGIEIYDHAGKEQPVMTIYNTGVILSASPGAAVNIGSGHANVGVTESMMTHLHRLAEVAAALAQETTDPAIRDDLAEPLDDLRHELEHATPSERHLRKLARQIIEIGGAGISGFLGNAAWGAIAAWLAAVNTG